MNIEIIEGRLRAGLEQVEKIKTLKAELEVLKNSKYYEEFGTPAEQKLDIAAKEAEISNQELHLLSIIS